ncbi:MAG: diacylglycerol/lipid kinase family protein [Candidatus Binatia bacterium]
MRITLIHNPEAGDNDRPSGDQLVKLIRGAGHSAVYHSSKVDNWDSALKEPGDIVAVAGGDGMVGKVAKRLIGSHIPIAVLPMGTANNIAKALGLAERSLEDLISEWTHARKIKFDVGLATGAWGSTCFIESLGLGLFTQTMYRLDARDNIDLAHADDTEKKITSVLELLQGRLQSCAAKALQLTIDDHDLSGQYVLVEVMNIRSIGPNLCLAPDADPGDGLLDVVLVPKGEENKLSRYLSDCIAGKPSSPDLTVRKGRRLQFEWEGSVVHIDDEVWPEDGSIITRPPIITVKVNPESVHFLITA